MNMTDSENSQPQDDSDEDIYKDIPEFNFEDELAKLEGSKETYKQEASDLSEKVKVLTEENKDLKKSNEVLKKNLSTLLKTAQAEIQRKDSLIEELRSKVDSFTFRRGKKSTLDKVTSTDDLNINSEVKQECEKQKSDSDRKRSKSYENRTSSDSDRRFIQDDESKNGSQSRREENMNCDNDRKSGYYRENSQNSNFKHSDGDTRNEKSKERKFAKYDDSSGHRRAYRESHTDHQQYDSYDRKRHSRSSDNRFRSRWRDSRERRHNRSRSRDSRGRRRSHRREDSSERSRRRDSRADKSRSRGSKESSLEKVKSRSSRDKDSVSKGREVKTEILKGGVDNVENAKRVESNVKTRNEVENVIPFEKNKQKREKSCGKGEKRKTELFSTKSPLDALYNDMVNSRTSNRFLNAKEGINHSDSDLEEGELFTTVNEEPNQVEEDWTLSFKNERKNEQKPMTLYSRRMMQRLSSATREKAKKTNEGKKEERKSPEKVTEKEPGELTDDENVIESSKEFQELTKVAAIESEIIEKPKTEPVTELKKIIENPEPKPTPTGREKLPNSKEDPVSEAIKDTPVVIEFSPFKNNYKLIEISPIKPSPSEHILDFYNKQTSKPENNLNSSEEKPEKNTPGNTSEEKDSWKNSSSENNSEAELKIVSTSIGSSKEGDKTEETNAVIEKETPKVEKESTKQEDKKSKGSKQEEKNSKGSKQGKRSSKKETEKPVTGEKNRKRKLSEGEGKKTEPKKAKMEKSEPPRKSTRNKPKKETQKPEKETRKPEKETQKPEKETRNPEKETQKPEKETRKPEKETQKPEKETQKPEKETKPVESETPSKEDISTFEFFKPIATTIATTTQAPGTPVCVPKDTCTSADFKMTATMSLTGVVRLETPNKCLGNLKNLMINEQMILNVLDPKNHSQFSPLVGSKSIEMTPRRMLKNDLMLTDSEDDSMSKGNTLRGEEDIDDGGGRRENEEEIEMSESEEYSDCDSDSGASNFVDLL